MKNGVRRFSSATLFLLLLYGGTVSPTFAQKTLGVEPVDLSPASWPDGELERYQELNAIFGGQNALATSDSAVITGTTSASAIRAGLEAIRQGGTAVDAAITTSLTQIALAKGCWVSYAGFMTLMYYDAESNQVFCLNAGYNTVAGEEDPLTIPKVKSGRTALVPGYMAGIEAAHDRFGKLPFRTLFQPAIYFADEGFVLHEFNARVLTGRRDVLSRFESTKRIFVDDQGKFFEKGDRFRQPGLAKTLRAVADQGASYMYTGPWAQKLVEAVQSDGGKLTEQDLRDYQPLWTTPIRIGYGGYEVLAPGLPGQGGVHVGETLNVMARADLKSRGHYADSPESFFWLSQIQNLFTLSFLPPETQKLMVGIKIDMTDRLTDEYADRIWEKIEQGDFALTQKPRSTGDNHSDAVVAIDRWGNIAAMVHTINTASWGQTGIFVDGVSIPDSASFQQLLIQQTEAGQRLPDPTEPLIILKDGQPLFALSSIGSGLHQKTIACLINLLDFDFDLKQAIDAPSMHLPAYSSAGLATQNVFEGDFTETLIDQVRELGLDVNVLSDDLAARAPRGYVIGASIDRESGKRSAISTDTLNAPAMGFGN